VVQVDQLVQCVCVCVSVNLLLIIAFTELDGMHFRANLGIHVKDLNAGVCAYMLCSDVYLSSSSSGGLTVVEIIAIIVGCVMIIAVVCCVLGTTVDCILHIYRSVHLTNLITSLNLVSTDLISSELSGCEATRFAVAATNQNGLLVTRVVTLFTVGFQVGCATCCVLIGQ